MPYCSRCGVEVHPVAVKCPLCNSAIQKFPEDSTPGRSFPEDELIVHHFPRMNRKERLQLASVITAFGMLVPVLICVAVDLMINRSVTWSLYPVVSLSSCLLIVLTALFNGHHPGRMIWIIFFILVAFLQIMAALSLFPEISGKLGGPIVFFAAFSSHITVIVSKRAKKRGSNIAAFILIAVGLLCLFTDLWLNTNLQSHTRAGWSLIVLAATQPITLILLYLHYRKSKNSLLKKYFHV